MTDLTDAPTASDVPAAVDPAPPTERALPVVDDPDAPVSRPKEARRQARRDFLKVVGAVGVGVGLAFTDSLSTRFARPAGAAAYEMWRDCAGYYNSSTTCVPSTAYYGADNCGADGWHHQVTTFEPWPGMGLVISDYVHLPETCRGRNAWLWRWSSDGWATKCSDGRLTRYSGDTVIFRSFSICRTNGFY